jgi:hypothetical protein
MEAADVFQLMLEEATQFLKTIDAKRQGKTFLLLVLECDMEDVERTGEALKRVRPIDPRMSVGAALSRYDDDDALNAKWQKDWINLIINHTNMPVWMKLRCQGKRLSRAFRQQIKGKKVKRSAVEIQQ